MANTSKRSSAKDPWNARNLTLSENAAAISDCFHSDKVKYRLFYQNHGEDLSGFPGIWTFIGRAAVAFTNAEVGLKVQWDGTWIDSVDKFAAAIHPACDKKHRPLTDDELYELAVKIIKKQTRKK